MPDEIKLVVSQEAKGTAVKDAIRDTDELQKKQAAAASASPAGSPAGGAAAARGPQDGRHRERLEKELGRLNQRAEHYDRFGNEAKAAQARRMASEIETTLRNPDGQRRAAQADAVAKSADVTPRNARAEQLRAERATAAVAKQGALEKLAAERAVTRQKAEQLAIEKAMAAGAAQRYARLARVGGAVGGLAMNAVGASPLSGVSSAVGATGPIGKVLATIGAVLGSTLAVFQERARNRELSSIEERGAKSIAGRKYERMRREGSSGAAYEDAEGKVDERVALLAERDRLKKEAEVRWYDPASWANWATGASDKKLYDNARQIEGTKADEGTARKAQHEWFNKTGELDLQAQEKRLGGDQRGARDLEYKAQWQREYNRLLKEGSDLEGEDKNARRGADLAIEERRMKEGMLFARGINARSGAGDIAMAAKLASGELGPRSSAGAVVSALDRMHNWQQTAHQERMQWREPRQFKRR